MPSYFTLTVVNNELLFLSQTCANAVFELRLKKFVNQYGRDTEGHCCSGFRNSQGQCSGTCRTKFRVCLKVYQEVIDPKSPCTFGEAETPILGENEVDFSKADLAGFVNPVRFQLASWQVRNACGFNKVCELEYK